MANPFLRKLESLAPLSADHRREIESITERTVKFSARESLVRTGDEPQSVNVVMSGWACRYKILPDGRREILSLFLPGDTCDPYVFLLGAVDYAIAALTPCVVAKVSAQSIRELTATGPLLGEALWRQTLVTLEIQREWTFNLGRRNALERVAHLFCEVLERLVMVGLSNGADCDWPLTQTDLADASGLSAVHVNRSLQDLRGKGFVEIHKRRLIVHDRDGLVDLAMFDPTYLHQQHP